MYIHIIISTHFKNLDQPKIRIYIKTFYVGTFFVNYVELKNLFLYSSVYNSQQLDFKLSLVQFIMIYIRSDND